VILLAETLAKLWKENVGFKVLIVSCVVNKLFTLSINYKFNGYVNFVYKTFSNNTIKKDLKVKSFVRNRICKSSSVFPTTDQCCTPCCEK